MRGLEAVWASTIDRYPFLAEVPPFKSKELYQAYEKVFNEVRPINTVLELGIYQGGSLILWREALRCRVIGVDLSPPPKTALLLERYVTESHSQHEMHTYWRTDQTNAVALSDIVKTKAPAGLDVIIDDASHLYTATRRSFEILFPLLRSGGIYAIEDWMAGKRPDFTTDDGPIARAIHELVEEFATAVWPIDKIEIHADCALVSKGLAGRPVLRKLLPERTRLGERFNPQVSGRSALAVACNNATRESVVVFAGTALETTLGSRHYLTAIVPDELVSKAGQYEVFLRDGGVESNRLSFDVEL